MPTIKIVCPNIRCRQVLAVRSELRGTLSKCGACRTTFRVPAAKPRPPKDASMR